MYFKGSSVMKNKLFHVIQTAASEGQLRDVSLRTNKEYENYYFFALAVDSNPTHVGDYQLTDHHLSVFEEHAEGADAESQYHYTAYFTDFSEQKFRLHVHYDARDRRLVRLYFSVVTEDGTYEDVVCEEHEVAFQLLAEGQGKQQVFVLRELQSAQVKKLEKECFVLEQQCDAISGSWRDNRHNYSDALNRLIQKLDELCSFTHNTRFHTEKIKYLHQLQQAVINSAKNPEKTETAAVVQERPEKKFQALSQLGQFKVSTPKPVEQKPFLGAEVQKLDALCNSLKTQSNQDINTLYQKIKELVLEVDFNKYCVEPEDINALHALKVKVEKFGAALLKKSLVLEHYEQASQLSSFYSLLDDVMVPVALAGKNSRLLKFLLSNGMCSVHTKNISVKGTVYASAVDFCFKNADGKDNDAMLDCLDVLLQHEASLMEIDEVSGLPFAAMLLSDFKNPLKFVLNRHDAKILRDPMFYKKLNQALLLITSQTDCSAHKKKQIEQLIKLTKESIHCLNSSNLSGSILFRELFKHTEQTAKIAKNVLGEDIVQKLIADSTISLKISHVGGRVAKLIPQLTKGEQIAINKAMKLNKEDLIKEITLSFETPTFDEVRQEMLRQISNRLDFLDLREELLEVQKEIAQPKKLYNKKQIKKLQRLADREKELIDKINQLNQDLNTGISVESVQKIQKAISSVQTAVDNMLTLQLEFHNKFSALLDKNEFSIDEIEGMMKQTNPFTFFDASKQTVQENAVNSLPESTFSLISD